MIYFKKILFFLIFFLNFLPLTANDKISYIDIDFIINNSELGKKVLKELENINQDNLSKLKPYQIKIKNDENEIDNQKNIISKIETDKRIKNLKQQINDYNQLKNSLIKKFNTKKQTKYKYMVSKISPIIEDYMKENSISILMDKKNIFIAKPEYDITKSILDLINLKLK